MGNRTTKNRNKKGKKKALKIALKGWIKRLGSVLLFHTLVYSTIGDEGLDF